MAEPKVRFRRDDGSSYPAWRTIPMSEVFTEISEKNHPELPVLSVQQGVGTVLRDSSDRNILYDKSNLKNYKAMKKDDYIIHLRSFEGGLECSNYDGISSPAYRILRSQAILPAAYRDYFRSYEFIHNKLAVSVVGIRDGKNIDMDTFWQIPMSIPCIEEQQKIAVFLSSVDAVITASEQEVANLEMQKKAVMKKIFTREVRFKRADGSDYSEWEETTLGEICAPYNNSIVDGPFGSNLKTRDYTESGVLVFQSNYITSGSFYIDKPYYITEEKAKELKRCFAKSGDILIAKIGARFGMCDVIPNGIEGILSSNSMKVDLDSKVALNTFYKFYLRFLYDIKYHYREIGITAQPALSLSYIRDLKVPLPCLEEQGLIVDFFFDFDEAIVAAKKELELWKELKKGLLQQLFV